ncbi:MAG: hypothetical protein WCG87_08765, partial [Bacteroidota bacterium]
MLKISILSTLLLIGASNVIAQNTYLQLGTEDYNMLDRLETRSGHLSDIIFTEIKPISRKNQVEFLSQQRDSNAIGLSSIDKYNIDQMISKSGEWVPNEEGAIPSKKAIWKSFYQKQADMIHVKTKDFFLVVNPVILGQALYEKDNPKHTLLTNSHGVEIRGWISKKVGFYTYFTDNQERTPMYVDQLIAKRQAIPGADYYTTATGTDYDYFLARGY